MDDIAKRLFDIVLSLVGLVVAAPLCLVAAAAIKLDSPGPVFFRGRRVGRYGVPFRLLKLRSMRATGAATDCSVGKGDKRVTQVGAVIRSMKIDELPQFVNVLSGQMSIVGPRPELWRYRNTLTGKFGPILEVRPGLTDLATLRFSAVDEVLGAVDPDRVYEETVLPQKNLLRLRYVESRTFLGDLRIIMATIACLWRSIVIRVLKRANWGTA
jgi:lipopolysaccharide/colanic/teichoic acid biosynthesis glycosyltransferase